MKIVIYSPSCHSCMTFFALRNKKYIFLESFGNPTILVVPVYAQENFENRTKYICIRVSKWWQNLFILSWIVSLLRMNCTHWYHCSFVWAFCFFNSKQKHQIHKATFKLSNGVKMTKIYTLNGAIYLLSWAVLVKLYYARQKHWLLWVGCNL